MGLNKIESSGSWGKAASDINSNFNTIGVDLEKVKNATIRNKGYFSSSSELKSQHPTANVGDVAHVGDSYPYAIWKWNGSNWYDTGSTGGEHVNLGDYYTRTDINRKFAIEDDKLSELDKKGGYYTISLSEYNEQNCSLGSKDWYSEGEAGRHKAIPVNGKMYIRISALVKTYIGFVTSGYKPPYVSGDVVPYCSSQPTRIRQEEGTTVQYSIPSDCAYIILTTVDGGGVAVEYYKIEMYNSNTSCAERLNNIESAVEDSLFKEYRLDDVELDSLPEQNCSLGSKGWYSEGVAGRHKYIPVNGTGIVNISVLEKVTYIGFVTSGYKPPYVSGDVVPYCSSQPTRIRQEEGTTVQYSIPSDCAYIILTTVDGGGMIVKYGSVEVRTKTNMNLSEHVSKTDERLGKVEFALESGGGQFVDVELDNLPEQNCSLGSQGWYIYDSAGRHKAIPVNGLSIVNISVLEKDTYIGFVTSGYKPPYSHGDVVPYCSSQPTRIRQEEGTTVQYSIPSDCAYIILTTVDGAGMIVKYGSVLLSDNVSFTAKLKELETAIENGMGGNTSGVSRLKVMSWNIGHYCNGTGVNTAITDENYMEKRTAFREVFNRCAADFLGLVEYSDVFNGSTGESSENAIISQYQYKLFGGITVGGYVCNGIASVVKPISHKFIEFALEYYAIDIEVKYMGSKFNLCVAHLPWQNESYNLDAINKLITHYATTQKVVIVGDFNVRADNYYDLFSSAGYKLANHGYMGDLITYPNESPSHILDNILVKGGQILSTEVIQSNLSDHYPIVSEIII